MARPKYDGVIQAVRYDKDGNVLFVRAYLRRGPTWSDHILLDRDTLVKQIKSGKQFVVGNRVPQMASTFETSAPVKLLVKDSQEVLVTNDMPADVDNLQGVPLI